MDNLKDFTTLSDSEKLSQIWLETVATNSLLHTQIVAQAHLIAHFTGRQIDEVRAELFAGTNQEYERQLNLLKQGNLRSSPDELG